MELDLDRVLASIAKQKTARSDMLAAQLKLAPEALAAMLQPAVESGYLVACAVIRPGKPDAVDYRVSEAASGAAKAMSFGDFRIVGRPKGTPIPLKQIQPVRRQIAPAISTEPVMAKDKLTRQQVLAAIVAAGKTGIHRKTLIEQFGVPEANIDMHVTALFRQSPPVIYKPERGLLCAIEFESAPPARTVVANAAGTSMAATWQVVMNYLEDRPVGTATMPSAIAKGIGCTEESTRKVLLGLFAGMKIDRTKLGDDFSYFVGEGFDEGEDAAARPAIDQESGDGAQVEPAPASAVISTQADPLASPSMSEQQVADFVNNLEPEPDTWPNKAPEELKPWHPRAKGQQEAELARNQIATAPAGFDEVVFTDAAMTEMAVWSNGALTIDDGAITVQLSVDVTRKLRNYLGLFEGAATC